MGKVVAQHLLGSLVISFLLNVPVLLVLGSTGRVAALLGLGALALAVAAGAVLHRRQPGGRRVTKTLASGTVELQAAQGTVDQAGFVRQLQRRRRLARLQLPLLLLAVLLGSLAGAAVGPWWSEVLGGAAGYALGVGLVLWLLFPRGSLSAFRRSLPPGAPGLP